MKQLALKELEFSKELQKYNMKIFHVGEDGNCLFRAFSH